MRKRNCRRGEEVCKKKKINIKKCDTKSVKKTLWKNGNLRAGKKKKVIY